MSNPEDRKPGEGIFTSLDGAKATHEPTAVIYDARTAGKLGVTSASFLEIAVGEDAPTDESESDDTNQEGEAPSADEELAVPEVSPEEKLRIAEQTGYDRGLAEGKEAQKAEYETQLSELSGAMNQLEQGVRASESNLSKEAVLLAMQIAEKVLRKSLAKEPAALAASVESFLGSADNEQPVRIHCHPDAVEALRNQMTQVAQRLQVTQWVVEADHELQAGDLLVGFGPATIDARITHRMERIEQSLFRELGLESHEGNIQ